MFNHPAIRTPVAIALGTIPGALSRYYLTELTKAAIGEDLAYYGTFMINITGCFIIALFYTLNEERFKNWSTELRLMIATGFCGAYTTFSAYGLETFTQLQKGNFTIATMYWFGSASAGLIAVQLGVRVGRITSE